MRFDGIENDTNILYNFVRIYQDTAQVISLWWIIKKISFKFKYYCGYINSMGYRINHFRDTFKSKSWTFSSYPKFQKSVVLWKISKEASFPVVVNSQMCIWPPCHSRHVKGPMQSWWQRLWQWREKAVRNRYAAQGTQVTFSWWKKIKWLELKGLALQIPSLYFKSSSIKHWVLWLPHFKTDGTKGFIQRFFEIVFYINANN